MSLAYLRSAFQMSGAPVHKVRKRMDSGGSLELRRGRVAYRRVEVGGVGAEWVVPKGHGERVIVYLHGGGYAFGSVSSHRTLITDIALRAGQRVLALEYRLAPEHPCPAGIEDLVAVWRQLLGSGLRPDQLSLMGDSAGGGLTLSGTMALRDQGLPLPRDLTMLSPWVDLAMEGATYEAFEHIDFLGTRESLAQVAVMYAGDVDLKDPRVSPLYGELTGLPPSLILAGGAEILLDDSLRLTERLRRAGCEVRLDVAEGQVHVYPMFSSLSKTADAALDAIAAWLR
jgi:monoterpene epsilon-lactone hydrolase